jgi:hypothetical protein
MKKPAQNLQYKGYFLHKYKTDRSLATLTPFFMWVHHSAMPHLSPTTIDHLPTTVDSPSRDRI